MLDNLDRLIWEIGMSANRRNCPGDPLFIQVNTINEEHWRERIVGTPVNMWMHLVSTAWIIDRRGRIKCIKDNNEVYRRMDPKPKFINELFETIEEMLTHEQEPIRSWGRWYYSCQQRNYV